MEGMKKHLVRHSKGSDLTFVGKYADMGMTRFVSEMVRTKGSSSFARKHLRVTVKVVFYIVLGPLNALHTFCPPWQTCSFRHQLGFSGKHSSHGQQLRTKTKSLTCPPLSIARYSFIQLSQLERRWRERKWPIFDTVAKGYSNLFELYLCENKTQLMLEV